MKYNRSYIKINNNDEATAVAWLASDTPAIAILGMALLTIAIAVM